MRCRFTCWIFLYILDSEIQVYGRLFNIGFFAPRDEDWVAASSSVGAFLLALGHTESGPLAGHTFNITWMDSQCSSKGGVIAASDLHAVLPNIDVFIGPPCSSAMRPVAQLASHWNIPVFGWVSSDTDLEDKRIYSTLVRLLGPLKGFGSIVLSMSRLFLWQTFAIIESDNYIDEAVAAAIKTTLDLFPGAVKYEKFIVSASSTNEQKQSTLLKVRAKARIILFALSWFDIRDWVLEAYNLGMTSEEYAYFVIEDNLYNINNMNYLIGDRIWKRYDVNDAKAREGFKAVSHIIQDNIDPYEMLEFVNSAGNASETSPYKSQLPAATQSDSYAPYLYDCVMTWANIARDAIDSGMDPSNGTYMQNRARHYHNSGITGDIVLDANADRVTHFKILNMQPNGRYEVSYQVMTPTNSTQMPNVTSSKPFYWADGSTGFDNAPDDVPMCGFSNEKCKEDEYRTIKIAIPSVGAAILALLFIISVLVTRKMKKLRIQSMPWKLNPEELIDSQTNIPRSTFQSIMSIHDNDSQVTLTQKGLFSDKGYTFAKVANYRGSQVAVKAIHKDVIHMTKDILIELHTMHSMKHVHVCYFVGASVEPNNIFVCWEYCSKGSLQDVLWNDNIKLDKNFKISLAFDVIKGLEYIHNTSIGYHGNLKSSNCVIDSYLSCKLTDFGLRHFRKGEAQVLEDEFTNTEHVKYKELFWTPPEDLAISLDEKTGTKPSDMYACGIIIKEILCRNGPYTEFEELTPKEIINKIREGSDKEFFRPLLPVEVRKEFPKCSSLAIKLWNELPETRPTVAEAHKIMKRCSSNTTVVDNMINTLEKYANNLEDIVIDRTKQLAEEKTRSEALLYRMLPRDVAEDLKKGISVKAESFDSVTIYFSDIVSFTSLCARSTPYQVVDMLNALYTIFDAKISKHDVYKVETIGDAYMLVSGLPKKNGEKHAQEIANCALEIRNAVLDFKVPHVPEYSLKIRIGLHTGPAVAGVVGLTMPRYCLFGDTVNTASRMESNSLPMMINMSESTFQLLQQTGSYLIQSRGQIDVKGKGCMNLYFLNEKVRRNNNSSIETRVISTQDDPARNHKKTIKHSIGENTRHTPNKYRSIPNNDDNIPNCDDKTPYNHDNTQNDDDNIRNYDDKTLKNDDTRSNHCQLNGRPNHDVEELLSSISDGERSTPVVVEI